MQNDRFIELLTRQLSSALTDEESIEFRALLARDEANRRQFEVFKDFWEQKDQQPSDSEKLFNNIKNRIATETVVAETEIVLISLKRNYIWWRRFAAAVVLIVCLSVGYKWKSHAVSFFGGEFATLDSTTTSPRSKSIITLTDGTQVTLNSESTLKYPLSFNGKTREVFLVGEAFSMCIKIMSILLLSIPAK